MNLPSPIKAYFEANARLDAADMLVPFAPDAVVRDEGSTHQGTAAIGAWIREASLAIPAIAAPRTIRFEDGAHHVTAEVSGSFRGSPVTLPFHFRLSDGRIAELEIG